MKAIVDEGVPRRLAALLNESGVNADYFREHWRGLKNGNLIAAVEAAGYDCLLSNDKNLVHQQSLTGRKISVVALPTNRASDILGRVDDIADTIQRALPGQHVVIDMNGSRKSRQVMDGERTEIELPSLAPFGKKR